MEQKEGVVFFLKLLIFPIEKEICINCKQHFVVFLFTDRHRKCGGFFSLFFSPTSWAF